MSAHAIGSTITTPLRPLPLACVLAVGIAGGRVLGPWDLPLWMPLLPLALAAACRRAHVMIVAVAVIGLALGVRRPPGPPAGITSDDDVAERIVGQISGPVVRTDHGTGATLKPDGVERSELWVWADGSLVPGERVAVTGIVRSPRGSRGPGVPQPARPIHELTAHRIERLGDEPGPHDRIWRWASATQARWRDTISAAGGDPVGRAALTGIITGDRSKIPPALDDRWRALGIYHVLSVSGLHLAVVAGLAFAILRRLIAASPFGGRVHPARWAAPAALVIGIGYTLVTGAQLATVRALVVVAFMLIAAMLDRPARLVDALGIAALVLLAWRPEDLADPSFQLTFVAALTLSLRRRGERRGVAAWLARGLATSAWIALTTAPITAYHFHQVAVGGVIGNLVLTPPIELVALPLGLLGTVLGACGEPLIWIATWIVTQIDHLAAVLAHATPVGAVAVAGASSLAILVLLSVTVAARDRRSWLDLACWIALCAAWATARTPPPAGTLRVTFLDVGQGDATIVELPDGAVWLIDAGGHPSARDVVVASAPGVTIRRALAAYGHARVDVALVSHPHPDHYLGLLALGVPIGELWVAAATEPATEPATDAPARRGPRAFSEIVTALVARGTRLVHPALGLARVRAGVELVIWAPRYQPVEAGPVVAADDPVRSVNDNSLVLELRYRGRRLLFTGDLEQEGEEVVVDAGIAARGRIDVVKVAHHGSPTSSSPRFIAATSPTLAVISCGRANPFGFPAAAVIARWRAAGAATARTDTEGAITVSIDAAGVLDVQRFGPAP